MTIKEVAKITKLSPYTIRFYEKRGLIRPIRNQENRYRIYSQKNVQQLLLIKKLQQLNFTLEEIKDFLPLLDGHYACKKFENQLCLQRAKIVKKIQELKNIQKQLDEYIALCKNHKDHSFCISIQKLL